MPNPIPKDAVILTQEQAKALVDHFWTTMHFRDEKPVQALEAVRQTEIQLWKAR